MLVAMLMVILLGSRESSSISHTAMCRVINKNHCLEDANTSFSVYYVKSLEFYRASGLTWFICGNCTTPENFPESNATYAFQFNTRADGKKVCLTNTTQRIENNIESYYEIPLCKLINDTYQKSHLVTSPLEHVAGTSDFTFGCYRASDGGPRWLTRQDRNDVSSSSTARPFNDNYRSSCHLEVGVVVFSFFVGFVSGLLLALCCWCCCRGRCKRQKSGRASSVKSLVENEEVTSKSLPLQMVVPPQMATPKMVTPKVVPPEGVPPKMVSIKLDPPSTIPPNDTGPRVIWAQPGNCNIAINTDRLSDPAPEYDDVRPWPPADEDKPQFPVYDAVEW